MLSVYATEHAYTGIVEALVDSAADKSEATRQAVVKALVDIGRKKHGTVLEICHSYLKKHSKVGLALSANYKYLLTNLFNAPASPQSPCSPATALGESVQGTHPQS